MTAAAAAPLGVTVAHGVAHVAIFAGYMMATLIVVPTFRRVLKVSRTTLAAAALLFACSGLTHLGLALGAEHAGNWFYIAVDLAQAVAIWGFMMSLYYDVDRALYRLTVTLLDLREAFYVRMREVEAGMRESPGGSVDVAKTSQDMAEWTARRVLAAFMDTEAGDPPRIARRS